jgi:hypothetical protein
MDASLNVEKINCEFLNSRAEKINWNIFNTESASSKLVAEHIDSANWNNPNNEPQITNTIVTIFGVSLIVYMCSWLTHKFCTSSLYF